MGIPSKDELAKAIAKANEMRNCGQDPDFLAKSLLHLNHQLPFLNKVLKLSKIYLHSGQDAHEHSVLLKAIEEAENASKLSTDQDNLGLDAS